MARYSTTLLYLFGPEIEIPDPQTIEPSEPEVPATTAGLLAALGLDLADVTVIHL